MRLIPGVAAVVAVALLSTSARAQRDSRSRLLISPADLAQRLNDRDLVLLHFGERAAYDSAHIPGARYVTLQDISVSGAQSPDGLTLQLPSPEDLRTRLAALGIGDKSFVVVYFGKDWISPTTRMLFTLDYAGLGDRSAMLDGGMPRWQREGRTVTTDVATATTGSLSALRPRALVVDADWVNRHRAAPHVSVVDSRDTIFYKGTRAGGRPGAEQRAGHIAGAKSVFFTTLYDSTGALLPDNELRARFVAAGVHPGDTVVTYCHIGQQASATLFAARALGHPVLLYDGSFEDWSKRTELPVEKP